MYCTLVENRSQVRERGRSQVIKLPELFLKLKPKSTLRNPNNRATPRDKAGGLGSVENQMQEILSGDERCPVIQNHYCCT